MYRIVREAYEPGVSVHDEFAHKTAQLVQKHTESGPVKKALEVYKIDENTLKKIQDSGSSDTEKVFNLLKSILDTVRDRAEREPYLISIGERAELIASLYKQRQATTQKTLEGLKDVVEEINAARKEREEKDMPTEVFSIFWILKKAAAQDPEGVARQMKDVLESYPHWARSEKHEREVKQALYRNLAKAGLKETERLTELCQRVMTALKGEMK
jgi:type I restriction enzyme R subunit